MLKKINLSLYKNLLFCDFFLIKQDFSKIIKKDSLFYSSFKTYKTLNLLELVKNIKQLVYILKFIVKKKFNNIIVRIENLLFLHFINFFFNKYPILKPFFYFTNILTVFTSNIKKYNFLYCFLDNSSVLKENQIKKLIDNEIYLINLLKLEKSIKDQGIYKINTNLFNLKQILFFIILLNKIILQYLNFYYKKK